MTTHPIFRKILLGQHPSSGIAWPLTLAVVLVVLSQVWPSPVEILFDPFSSVDSASDSTSDFKMIREADIRSDRSDGLWKTNVQFQWKLSQYTNELAYWYTLPAWGRDKKPVYTSYLPDAILLVSAESAHILQAIRNEKYSNAEITSTELEIGSEPKLFPMNGEKPASVDVMGALIMPEISQDLMANFAEELEAKIEAELQISGLYNTMVVLGVYTNLVTEVVNTILSKTLPLSTEEYLRQVLDTNQASILSEPLVQIDTTISPPRLTYILPPRILIEEGRESPSSLPMKSSRDPNLNSKSNSNSNANSNSPRILAGPAVGFSIKMAAAGRSFQIMRMSLPVAASVRVQILDARGQSRRTLFKGRLESGKHAFPYDGRGERGRSLPAGIYFCRFQANAEVRTIPASNLP